MKFIVRRNKFNHNYFLWEYLMDNNIRYEIIDGYYMFEIDEEEFLMMKLSFSDYNYKRLPLII